MSFTRTIPHKLEEVLLSYVKQTYLPEKLNNPKRADEFNLHDIKFFARGVAEMSAYFTSERARLPKNYLNKKELRAGYILYFVMPNFLKAYFCLKEADLIARFKGKEEVKIADIGCGPGTASLACAEYWRGEGQKISITAIDQNTGALHDAKKIFEAFRGENAAFYTNYSYLNRKTISHKLKGKYDVVIMANFLSELGRADEQALLADEIASHHLEKNGVVIIIDPALRWTTRNLMKARDLLLAHASAIPLRPSADEGRRPEQACAPRYSVMAPCLHAGPCPMLAAGDRDWCHMYISWKRPTVIEQIDRFIGNRKDYLKFSYLILTNHKSRIANHDLFRVVSAPMRSKGKIEILLCNERGLIKAVRFDKDSSESNDDIDKARRGDLVLYEGSGNIGKETKFRRVFSR